jgi:integrase
MASIYWRGRMAWIKWYEHGEMQRKSLGPISAAEAEHARIEFERRFARDHGSSRRLVFPGSAIFAEVVARFVEDKSARRERATEQYYRKHVGNLKRHGFPTAARIGQITPDEIARYLEARRRDTSPRTANKERVTLSTIFAWAERRGFVDRNPVRAVEPFAVRPEPPGACPESVFRDLVRVLRAEARAARTGRRPLREAAIRELVADLVEVCWHLGLRMGEACAIRREDVDARAARWAVTIRSAPNKGPAVLPIPPAARAIFTRHLARNCEFVFANPAGGPAYGSVYHFWTRHVHRHPEHAPAHFHALRHAYASRLEAAGIDLRTSQSLMRHATLRMTGHYSHRDLAALRAAQSRLVRCAGRGKKSKRAQRRGKP